MTTHKHIHTDQLPRERLLSKGPHALRDHELLAVLIGSGTAGYDVFSLARIVLQRLELSNYSCSPSELLQIPGMGPARAAQIAAAVELGRRVMVPRNFRIRQPADAVPLLWHYADRRQEHFIVIALNGAHEVDTVRIVSVGLVNRTLVHPREVFSDAVKDRAAAIIVAHNHPSGNVQPSGEDRAVTETLVEAGNILGIQVLDHIIFSPSGHYSFREHDELG